MNIWVQTSGTDVGARSYKRMDGLKLWYHLFEWRFKTVDCSWGNVPQDGWKPQLTTEEAQAWTEREIPLHLPRAQFVLQTL